jgi:hypothetical protein
MVWHDMTRWSPLLVKLRQAKITRKQSGSVLVLREGQEQCQFNGWWDEGSRPEVWQYDLTTGEVEYVPLNRNPPQFGGGATRVEVRPGKVLVEAGIFCGRPSVPMVYIREASFNAEEMLDAVRPS